MQNNAKLPVINPMLIEEPNSDPRKCGINGFHAIELSSFPYKKSKSTKICALV